jgi:hypothetical protein
MPISEDFPPRPELTPLSLRERIRFLLLVLRPRRSLTPEERRELADLARRLLLPEEPTPPPPQEMP